MFHWLDTAGLDDEFVKFAKKAGGFGVAEISKESMKHFSWLTSLWDN